MKRWRLVPAAIALLLLSGCWSRQEIPAMAPVLTMALDRTESGQIELALSVIRPGVAGKGAQRGGGMQVLLRREGATITDALRDMELVSSRRLSFRHTCVILIGERLARAGTDPVLDFFLRFPELRLTARSFVVRGTSIVRIMESPPMFEKLQGFALPEIERNQAVVIASLKDLFVDRTSGYRDAIMPTIGLYPHPARETEDTPPMELGLTGAVAFRKDRVAAFLGLTEARDAMWLRGRVVHMPLTVPCPDAPALKVSARVSSFRRRIIPRWDGHTLSFRVLLRGDLIVTDAQCPALDFLDQAALQRVQNAFRSSVQQGVQHVIAITQGTKSDPFSFGATTRARLPAAWKQVGEAKWPKTWSHVKVNVTAQLRIVHSGLSSSTPGADAATGR